MSWEVERAAACSSANRASRSRTGRRATEPFAPALLRSAARKYRFNSSRSFTRGTGVEKRRCTALTVFSASGFSLPRAGMQKRGLKT